MSHGGKREGARFYVYRLFDDPAVTLYVGKGSGSRFINQKRRFRSNGEILQYFDKEDEAYYREMELFSILKPTETRGKGGSGGWCRKGERHKRLKEEIGMAVEGPRRYVARMLLRFDPNHLSRYLSAAEIDYIKEIANGPWL